jgi:flagellar export protein FliJ
MSTSPRFAALVMLHERQEQEARRRLGDLERQRRGVVERIAALLDERHSAATSAGLAQRDQLARYWHHIELQVRAAQGAQALIERDMEAARAALADTHRAAAIFRKLQERDAEVRRRHAVRLADRRLEEFAARRHIERQETHP